MKKLGVGAKQRDGFEYEFTCTFLLDQKTNMADVQKDNTHIFEDDGSVVLTERHGEKVIEWANSGEGYTPPVRNSKPDTEIEANEINEKISQIDNLAKALGEAGVSKTDIANAIKKHFVVNGKPSANYNAIKNSEVAEMVIKELESLIK